MKIKLILIFCLFFMSVKQDDDGNIEFGNTFTDDEAYTDDLLNSSDNHDELPPEIGEEQNPVQDTFEETPAESPFDPEITAPPAELPPLNTTSTTKEHENKSEEVLINDYGNPISEGEYLVNENTQIEREKNYREISKNMKAIMDAYAECLNKIPDMNFSLEAIDGCTGPDFHFLLNDVDFEKQKLLSQTDITFRKLMVEECYKKAGTDIIYSHACDLFQIDVSDLIWMELNFFAIPDHHKDKYLKVFSKMPLETFNKIILKLKDFYSEIRPLLREINFHRELVLNRIKTQIKDRREQLSLEFKDNPRYPIPIIRKQTIEIEEKIIDPTTSNLIYPGLRQPLLRELNQNKESKRYALRQKFDQIVKKNRLVR